MAFKDNIVLDYAGLQAAHLAATARARLLDLIHLYVSNMDNYGKDLPRQHYLAHPERA
ncbi:MAG: hypothetical protein ACR2IV_20735 [Bryobacteraceae bacterium]